MPLLLFYLHHHVVYVARSARKSPDLVILPDSQSHAKNLLFGRRSQSDRPLSSGNTVPLPGTNPFGHAYSTSVLSAEDPPAVGGPLRIQISPKGGIFVRLRLTNLGNVISESGALPPKFRANHICDIQTVPLALL